MKIVASINCTRPPLVVPSWAVSKPCKRMPDVRSFQMITTPNPRSNGPELFRQFQFTQMPPGQFRVGNKNSPVVQFAPVPLQPLLA